PQAASAPVEASPPSVWFVRAGRPSMVANIPSSSFHGAQCTLRDAVDVVGVGFVTGADVTLRLLPAPADAGRTFIRADLPGRPKIPAHIDYVLPRRRRTAVGLGHAVVEMTEHILAALAGLGVDNCWIELDAPETPGMDGSAAAFVDAILSVGLQEQDRPRRSATPDEPSSAREGDAVTALLPGPADVFETTFTLDYGGAGGVGGLAKRSLHVAATPDLFVREIASARTFILEREAAALRMAGLGSRATTRDLLVLDEHGQPIDNAFRYPDECVRHKILDCIGDLALVGRPLAGHLLAHKSGHHLNTAVAKDVLQRLRAVESAVVVSVPIVASDARTPSRAA
ncbi:MAG: UDP-3-O-acyl-N-acetylglucosamine deacetylase, partial [Planctomycetia bacterium]